MLQDFINQLKESAEHRDILTHYRYVPEEKVAYGPEDLGLPPELAAALEHLGIPRLYRHQAEALTAIRAGKNLLVATPTASGKTLIYNLPVLEALLRDRRRPRPLSLPVEGPGTGPAQGPEGTGRRPALPFSDSRDLRRRHPARPAPGHQGQAAPCALSPTRTCCIWGCCPITPPGPPFLPTSSSWSSTKSTPTGASWAATWPRCCGGCGASAPTTAPGRSLSCLRPPSPGRKPL